jgi:outer membrane receptor protein involved in Fe transport
VSGRPNIPVELTTFSLLVSARNKLNLYAGYIADQWRASDRLTVNLGLRWERQTSYVPEQSQEASTFVSAARYSKVDVGAFNGWPPRVGMAWDLTGGGRTVVKATYGWYNTELLASVASISDVYNPVKPVLTTYHWRDPNGNGDYDPGEVDLSHRQRFHQHHQQQ